MTTFITDFLVNELNISICQLAVSPNEAVNQAISWFNQVESWSVGPVSADHLSVGSSLLEERLEERLLQLHHYKQSYFSFQPVLHDWCNKGHGMCNPIGGMVHIKEPLLLIGKSSLCGGSGFPFSPSEWSLTICLMPYNRK